MPVQRTFLGKPIPHIHPRRVAFLLGAISIFALFTLVFTLPNSMPTGPALGRFTDHKITIPKIPKKLSPSILNPFRPVAHAPPEQRNSTSEEASWYSNWNWLSPFSSSVTLDENRSLLPPLAIRPPIYTYYDHTIERESDLKDALNAILVTWRRAWWAQGFRPIILGPAEAMANPLYTELQMKDLEAPMKAEMSRWLAWEYVGAGMLSHYLTLPMADRQDPLLSYLRRGEYPQLTRFENLGSGLFSGAKTDITAAVKQAIANKDLKAAKDFIDAVTPETFNIDPKHDSLAYYSEATIKDKYPKKADELVGAEAKNYELLNKLIVAHLQGTWQNVFSNGIAVVNPHPEHMSTIVEPAIKLAEFLANCPESPLPGSCPPNQARCKPCVASPWLKVSTPSVYRNTSGLYTIGTVPHPYTMALVGSFRETINVPWIRRESERDTWLNSLTRELLGNEVSGAPRVIKFKEAVASHHGTSNHLWVTAERPMPKDLDWYFGFAIPPISPDGLSALTSERMKQSAHDGPVVTDSDLAKEKELLKRAKDFGIRRNAEEEKVRGAIEAWNLADTEAWRFARAFLSRSRVERLKWEEEEKHYAGGAGAERGKSEGFGRWFDDSA
jgi:hypothetical protein